VGVVSLSRSKHWSKLKLLRLDFLTALCDSMKNIQLKERYKTTRLWFYRHLKGETQNVTEERVQRGMLRIRRKN
jgi:hypothetical protein